MSDFSRLVGPSYQSLSKYAAVERCINFFPEVIEDQAETKTHKVLYPTPCTGRYSDDATGDFAGPSRGLIVISAKPGLNPIGTVDRMFGVNGGTFFEFLAPTDTNPTGTFISLGVVANDNQHVDMIANGVTNGNQQLLITSASVGYLFELDTNTFTTLTSGTNSFEGGQGAAFLDNYFASIIPQTNGFQVSGINDGIDWATGTNINVAYTQGQSDALANLIANEEYLYLFGYRRSEIWYNNPQSQFFPFTIQPGAFIEMGLGARYSVVQADNSIFYIGQDMRGSGSAWRLRGLTPVRISNHAVEAAWAKYSTITDAISYAFIWRGHIMIRFIFPTAEAGWTYDATTSGLLGYSVWHENNFTDADGVQHAPLERSHAYFNGVHVVGSGGADGFPGTLYQFTDDTTIDEDPMLLLRNSNDGGNVFGFQHEIPVGKAGEYETRCIADALGASRDRVFWVRCVDYGDGAGRFPILRDRICPHLFGENHRVFYHRLEIEVQKGIGSIDGATSLFWALVNAYLVYEAGVN